MCGSGDQIVCDQGTCTCGSGDQSVCGSGDQSVCGSVDECVGKLNVPFGVSIEVP